MDLDSSIASSFAAGEAVNLISLNPAEGRRIIRRVLNNFSDGMIVLEAAKRNINVDCDALILRDCVERYDMRRYYGEESAKWNSPVDEARHPASTRRSPLQCPATNLSTRIQPPTTRMERTNWRNIRCSTLKPESAIDSLCYESRTCVAFGWEHDYGCLAHGPDQSN